MIEARRLSSSSSSGSDSPNVSNVTLSHLDLKGQVSMVDVSTKKITLRTATASGIVALGREVIQTIQSSENLSKKGDVVTVSKVAGIVAAKSTSSLIPLTHQVPLSHVSVDIELEPETGTASVICTAKTSSLTGVEMEAMTGVAVACLTLYDMCKSINKGIIIRDIRLVKKSGGKSDFKLDQ